MATDTSTATKAAFPCALTLEIPFPDTRLASVALRALRVDKELSPLVHRTLTTVMPSTPSPDVDAGAITPGQEDAVLRVEYKAATNRMLRVAVNSFFDSLALVVEVMQELDEDVVVESHHIRGGGDS
ncbi:transcription factor Pcc1-domain-containing protein [Lasiosphaeria hispida]|uniref:Transcription factor Pcc1-domain-containing protein n=1 Tax=Lasiosphaeria hispida TaxID=260671 RepID=A0AAJ0H5V2_9PEZI|nr:transcription factor Pcc1-domain-containing protein [Lasiosphaeria hispida]